MPWSTVPVPPENTAVKVTLSPLFTTVGPAPPASPTLELAEKLVITGRGITVTVTWAEMNPFNVSV
jgi:hypothetical protein